MSEIDDILSDALLGQTCTRLVLSRPRSSAAGDGAVPVRVSVRPVTLAEGLRYQFTTDTDGQQVHSNLDSADAIRRVTELFASTFRDCHVFTTTADFSFRTSRGGRVHVHRSSASQASPPETRHDRLKEHLLPDGVPCPFLQAIGVMTTKGRVRSSRQKKFRQINRFLELVDDTLESLPDDRPIEVVDFGCGKSYLTFALHHLLTVLRGRQVRIVGLDRNPAVVADCCGIVEKLGLVDLSFRVGDIAAFEHSGPVDMAVSLHACDTATDDALARAVTWQTGIILAVPCCQQELSSTLYSESLASLQRHGILQDRLAALVTDALRAELLELCGYRTQVVEFIDLDHTAKNVLVRAVRRPDADRWPDLEQPHCRDRAADYRRLRASVDLPRTRLEEQLQERLQGILTLPD